MKKGENVIKAVYDGSEGNFTAIEYIYSYGTLTGMNIDAPEKAFKGEDYEFTVSLYNLEDDHIINENFEVIVTFDSQSYDEDIGPIWERIVVLNETVCGNATLTLTSAELEKYNKSYFEIHASFVCENHTYSPSGASEDFSFYKVYTYINIDKPVYIEGEDYTFTVSLLDEEDDSIIYKEFDVEVYYYGDFGDEYLWEGTVNGTQTITITDEDISPIKEYDDCFHISAEFYDEDNDYSSSSIHITVDLYDEPEPVDEEINDITFDGPPCDGTIIEITDEELIIGYVLIPEWDDTVVGVNMTVNGKLVYVNSTATMEKEYLPLMEAYRYAVYMNFSHIKDKDIFVFQLDCYDDDVYWVYVAKVVGNNLVFYDDYSDEINYYVFYGNTTTGDLNDPETMGPHPNGHFLELEIPDSYGITEGTVTISDGSKTLYTKSLSEIKEGYSYFVLGNSYAINLTDFDFSILPENRNVTVTFSSGNTTLSEKRIRIGDYVYLVNTPERIAEYFNITVADEKLIYGTDTVISIIGTDQLNPQSAVIDAGGGYFNVYVNGERIEDLGSLFEFDDEEEGYIPTELELAILGFREYRYFYLSLNDLNIDKNGTYNIRVTQYPGDADSTDHELSEYFYSTETEVLNNDITVRFITLTNVVTPELFKYYVDKYGTLTDEFDELTFVGNFSNISCKYLGITSPVTLIGQDAYFEDLFFEIAGDAENVTIRNLTLNYPDVINTPFSTGELSRLVLDGNTINYNCEYHNGRVIASDAKDVSIINNRIYAYGECTVADYGKEISAIRIWGAEKVTIDNNIITAEADEYISYGIRIYNSQGVTISNNVIAADLSIDLESSRAAINNNGIEGYMIVSGYNNTITCNNITTSEEYAIDLTDYTGNIVTNNNLFAQKTGNEAVKVNNDKNTIADNNVAKISTISLSDIVFDYGGSGSTTAVIANATGITDVKVLDKLKNPVNATVSVIGLKITVSGLDAGAYTLSATTVPATDYEASTATADITVNKVDSTLNADNIAFVYGQSGSTTVSYTGADDVSAVIAGHADSLTKEGNVITVSNLDAGVYVLTVATIADANHNSVSRDLTVNVSKAQSTLSVDNITFIFDEVGKGTVNYTGAIGVTAEIFNYPEASVTVNGNEITVSGLDTGKYKLIVTTTVDANHESATQTADVTVTKTPSTLSVGDVAYDYESTGYTTANFTGATAVTAVVVNHTEAVVTVNGNEITVTGLNAGNYQLLVTTVPDADHESVSEIANVTVNRIPSTISATDSVSFNYGSSGTVDVAYTGATGVTASVINHTEAVISITNSSVTVSGLAAGNYVLVVSTAVDGNHISASKSSNITVKKLSTTITSSKVTATYAVSKNLVITLKANGKALSGKSVTVTVGSIKKTLKTNSKGQVSVQVSSLVPKTYTATVKFAGDVNYTGTSKKVTVVVKKNTPKITAKTKSFKRTQKTKSYAITIKNSKNKAIKGLKAYIKVNGVTYSATTNAKGVATFKINKLTKKGSYTSTITVKVTKYYNKVTKKVTIKAT